MHGIGWIDAVDALQVALDGKVSADDVAAVEAHALEQGAVLLMLLVALARRAFGALAG